MTATRNLRDQLIAVSRRLHERGWVANHDGNVTARVGTDRWLATPTARSKADVDHDNLIEVDARGRRLSGTAKPFSELVLHMAVYAGRDDVAAVIHAHPPHATALACAQSKLLERPFIAEAVVSIGDGVPTVPFAMPGKPSADALAPLVGRFDAVLLANHGAMAWGADLEQAYLRLELVEHLARIAVTAQAVGGVKPLPDSAIAPLLAKRAKSGLGAAADRAGEATSATSAPARPGGDLRGVIVEEIARALRES